MPKRSISPPMPAPCSDDWSKPGSSLGEVTSKFDGDAGVRPLSVKFDEPMSLFPLSPAPAIDVVAAVDNATIALAADHASRRRYCVVPSFIRVLLRFPRFNGNHMRHFTRSGPRNI